MRVFGALLVSACLCWGEIRTMTLREAVATALQQNPELTIARLDEQKAVEAAREARDPFTPRLAVGSGLAYTNGFPMSIEGSAPSVVQAQAMQSFYNRPRSFQAAAAKENARGAAIDATLQRDEVVHRVAVLYLTAERLGRAAELLQQQRSAFEKIAATVRARIEEGRELAVEGRAAELRVLQTQQRLRSVETQRDNAEAQLSVALGFGSENRVRPAGEERGGFGLPASEGAAVDEALGGSRRLKRLESAMQARRLQAEGAKSSRYPIIDLVAQYALMARFNNYEEFFRRFQRHNYQFGVSFQLPVFAGSASAAQAAQANLDVKRLGVEMDATRHRIAVETHGAWREVTNAESARKLAQLDLDVTRERLNVTLAQWEEGRVPLRQVEELRAAETEKWLAFYDAQHDYERARLELLKATGGIMAALR